MSAPARTLPGDKGTADRIEADDGAYWVRLVTRQALDREGAWMDHCVGDGAYDGLAGSEDLTDDTIWSLRDAEGTPRLTAEVIATRLVFAKGYRNHKPGKGAALQVRHLVAAFAAAGAKLAVMPVSDIVLAPDGRTFRSDRVPADVQAALDAVERERQAERERRAQEAARSYVITYGQIMTQLLETRTDENLHRPLLGRDGPFRMVSMAEALGPMPEPRTGVTAYPQVASRMYYQVVPDGGLAHGIEVAAATAEGADLVAGEDYIVDEGNGLVTFTRDLFDLEILWRVASSFAHSELRALDLAVRTGLVDPAAMLDVERARVRAGRAGLARQVATDWSGPVEMEMTSFVVLGADTQAPTP